MPVGFSRGDYHVEQAIQSRYTYCLVCNRHIDAPPVFHYALGDDRIYLHAECVIEFLTVFVEDLHLAQSKHALGDAHLDALKAVAGVLQTMTAEIVESKPLPPAQIVDADPTP